MDFPTEYVTSTDPNGYYEWLSEIRLPCIPNRVRHARNADPAADHNFANNPCDYILVELPLKGSEFFGFRIQEKDVQ